MTVMSREDLTADSPERSLVAKLTKTGGRNNMGRITCRHHGGGHKQRYRLIDFRRNKVGVPGRVVSIEYDPNRTCRIALICYADGEKRYILCPDGLTVGLEVISSAHADIKVGNCLKLKYIPLGTEIHNVEMHPGKGGQLVRSAGVAAQLMAREGNYALLRMPSGELRKIHGERIARQSGPQPLAWHPSVGSRRCHEPCRSPARRRRRPHERRPSSCHAVGHPDQGQEDAS